MGKRTIKITLTPKTGSFERLSGWIGATLVINTEGGEGEGSAERSKPDTVISLEAVGTAKSTYTCEYGCEEHEKKKKEFKLNKDGSHEDSSIRC